MFVIYDDKKCKVVLDATKYKFDTETAFSKLVLLEVNDTYNCWSKRDIDENSWYYNYLEEGKYYWWTLKTSVTILKNKNMEIE